MVLHVHHTRRQQYLEIALHLERGMSSTVVLLATSSEQSSTHRMSRLSSYLFVVSYRDFPHLTSEEVAFTLLHSIHTLLPAQHLLIEICLLFVLRRLMPTPRVWPAEHQPASQSSLRAQETTGDRVALLPTHRAAHFSRAVQYYLLLWADS